MAHEAQNQFFRSVKEEFPEAFDWCNVIEIGSLDINGTVRDLFTYCNYVGFDLGPGPGVDYPVQGQEVKYRDGAFDTAISAECFEHNPYWLETFVNMHRMTRVGGLVTFTCAGEGRPEHGTSRSDVGSSPLTVAEGWDYYRNLKPEDFYDNLEIKDLFEDWKFIENSQDYDLYFWGIVK
jgi:SAM-dependent methyltransferase